MLVYKKVQFKNIISSLVLFLLMLCASISINADGDILVPEQQKDVTYTVDVNLPAVDELDVPFTVYVEADNKTYSKQGVVKSGEKSSIFEFEGLPVAKSYKTRIEFGYHKYKNAVLEDRELINIAYARDFKTNFTAECSRAVVCNVSLPDDFIPDGDVEIKVSLSKHTLNGKFVVDKLTDWTDSKVIKLDNEHRSEQICLYSQASSSKLSYLLISGLGGLCKKGYLHNGGKITSDSNSSKEIKENMVVDIPLLQKKSITVNVYRPFNASVENDIFATVELDNLYTANNTDDVIDFTQIPLIPSGERKSRFAFDVAEDVLYSLKINNITGDNCMFDYYCYVKPVDSPADEGKKWQIGFSDDTLDLTLLICNNISGVIECEKMDLEFTALATCNLHNGKTIYLTADVENGNFSFKIPEDTDTYTLDVQTRIGKKSYYVSDGVSTNDAEKATELSFVYDDRNFVIEYILQNPMKPIEISAQNDGYFRLENVSDYLIDEYDAYVAYYDGQEGLLFVEKAEKELLVSGWIFKLPIKNTSLDYNIKKVKAFAWKRGNLTPLGNVAEISVNQTEITE